MLYETRTLFTIFVLVSLEVVFHFQYFLHSSMDTFLKIQSELLKLSQSCYMY